MLYSGCVLYEAVPLCFTGLSILDDIGQNSITCRLQCKYRGVVVDRMRDEDNVERELFLHAWFEALAHVVPRSPGAVFHAWFEVLFIALLVLSFLPGSKP